MQSKLASSQWHDGRSGNGACVLMGGKQYLGDLGCHADRLEQTRGLAQHGSLEHLDISGVSVGHFSLWPRATRAGAGLARPDQGWRTMTSDFQGCAKRGQRQVSG